MKNAVGRVLPQYVEGYGSVRPYQGPFCTIPEMNRAAPKVKFAKPHQSKVFENIEDIFKAIPITDGMTLGFHHHFRNGDRVVNQILDVAARLGIKNLTIALSSIFPVHEPLVDHIKNGVITGLDTNYMAGPVAQAISKGILEKPVIFRTHGGRARAIECGQLHIDVAFIAAPAVDTYGNISGTQGPTACGSLGYAYPDVEFADQVVAVTDFLVPYPISPVSLSQSRVDYIVKIEKIGDPKGIVSGTTQITKDPVQLRIASLAAKVIEASGLLKNGFSFQTGAGGASLAVAHYIRQKMQEKSIKGSFALGGITGYLVQMLEEGLFEKILDVQDFDLEAIRSLKDNSNHLEIGAGTYANPFNSGCVVNQLDCVVLGATEMDKKFNVNVVTGSDGVIMGGSGGHSDAAAGAKLTIITANLIRSRLTILQDEVLTITTPGETVDVLVTEYGIAVNPKRKELLKELQKAHLPIMDIDDMAALAKKISGTPLPIQTADRIVGLIEYRDGTIIDVVRQSKEKSK